MSIKVVFFFRKPFTDYFSIEELFGSIQSALPASIEFENVYMRWSSKGLWLRFRNAWEAISKQAEINHITGDAKLRSRNTVVLTDGHTDVLDFSGMTGNVLVVSTSKECDVKGSNKVKQIVIK